MLKEKEKYNDKQIMLEIQINFGKTLEEAKRYIDEAPNYFSRYAKIKSGTKRTKLPGTDLHITSGQESKIHITGSRSIMECELILNFALRLIHIYNN